MIFVPFDQSYEDHLKFCKQRALEICNRGDAAGAYASFCSDMEKHPETAKHPAIPLGVQLMIIGDLKTPEKMRKFIEGFN